jgi:serine protease inhibitor
MKTSRMFFIVLVVGVVAACSRDMSYEPSQIIVRSLTANEQTVNNAGMDFGFEMLQKLGQAAPQENIFISPLSISMALAMTLNGAAGSTETAMRQTLRADDLTETERNEAYQSLIALLMSIDKSIQIEIANSIWIRQGFDVEPAFINTNQDYFGAIVQTLDFGNPSTLSVINNWVKQKTHDKIEKILDSIPAETVMYLMNAVYFKGDWTFQFDKAQTVDKEFHASASASSPCKMMIQTNDAFRYFNDDAMQAVDLPYGNGQFSMTVLLPAPDLSPQDLVAKMSSTTLQELPNRFAAQRGTLELPKFKLEYKETLNQVLTDMGMGIAFCDQADFTRINKAGNLLITEVLHKTFVKVDEEGTEAAAVTSVGIGLTSVGPPPGFFMTVDRPFLFFIREKSTGAVLFMGTVMTL